MAADHAAAEHPGTPGPPAPGPGAPSSWRPGAVRRATPASRVLADGVASLLAAAAQPPARVLDLGGGTGGLSVGLAAAGHDVVVVDPSPDALAALGRRAAEEGVSGRLHGLQGDAEGLGALLPDASVDLVLCHGVLEVVDDPAAALASCRRVLRPTGRLSLLVAGRGAAVLARVSSGNLRQARQLQLDPDGRWGEQDPLQRRYDVATATEELTAAGFAVLRTEGVGVFGALLPRGRAEDDPATLELLARLEQRASDDPALLGVASALHLHAAPA